MRLKVAPDDFQVRESLDFVEDRDGPYFIHRLRKEKRDTLEAISMVADVAQVDRAKIAFAGLKDRQGVTEQWISIEGKRADYRGHGIDLRFVGRSMEPITSKLSSGNDFTIVVRDLTKRDCEEIERGVPRIIEHGFANYFDDQRFSCLRHGQGFVMKEVLNGRWEEALRSLIARPSPNAITGDVKLKKLLARHWGDWEDCAAIARGPVWKRLFQHLIRDPDDFKGGLALLPARQKLIHAYAYQSYLWNRSVDLYLKSKLPDYSRVYVDTTAGSYVSWKKLKTDMAGQIRTERTPLYGPGGDGGSLEFKRAAGQVLRDAHLKEQDFVNRKVPGMVLREEPRALMVVPRKLIVRGPKRDERHPGQSKMQLTFGLPRGAYATMLIKHLFAIGDRSTHDSRPQATRRDDYSGRNDYRDRDDR